MENFTILYVDDDSDDLLLLRELIMEIDVDMQVIGMPDGTDAFEFLTAPGTNLPGLIFLDLNMPRMGGKEFLKRIKCEKRLSSIPVIMLSTSGSPQDIEETAILGAIRFIKKPNSYMLLKKEIGEVLSGFANLHQS